MHFLTYAMSNKFTYDSVTGCFAMLLNRISDIADSLTGSCSLYTFIKRFLCHLKQISYFFAYLAHHERVGRIPIIAIQKSSAIYRYDVTILQRRVIGYSVDHLFIYRCTNGSRKLGTIRIGKSLESRNSPIITYELFGYLIQLFGGYTRLDSFSNLSQGATYQKVGVTH